MVLMRPGRMRKSLSPSLMTRPRTAAFPARAYGSLEILQKNRASCPRPTGMHAKTQASSEAYSVAGMRFYLAVPVRAWDASAQSPPHFADRHSLPKHDRDLPRSWPCSLIGYSRKQSIGQRCQRYRRGRRDIRGLMSRWLLRRRLEWCTSSFRRHYEERARCPGRSGGRARYQSSVMQRRDRRDVGQRL